MAYTLKIKGKQESIVLDNSKGVLIKARWFQWIEGGKKRENDSVFETDAFTGLLSDIKSIEITKEVNIEKQDFRVMESEYRKERAEFIKQPLEVKANDMKFFSLVWWALTGKNGASDEIRNSVIDVQRKFFIENPNRAIPNPEVYKIIRNKTGNAIHKSMFSVIESIVREDVSTANKW